MKTLFISDLHLHSSRPHVTERFFYFLETEALNAEAIYILGDFFEVWAGDDNFNTHDRSVIDALAGFSKTNIPVYFMHGNRDFLIGQTFAKQAHCTLISDPTVIDLYGHRVLLMHGDSLCTLDVSHQRFRKFSRNPVIRWIFLHLPRVLRSKIAGDIRQVSKYKKSRPVEGARFDVTQDSVEDALRTHQAYCLIHGHTHKPGFHEFMLDDHQAKRIVLGDWGPLGNILIYRKDSIELKSI